MCAWSCHCLKWTSEEIPCARHFQRGEKRKLTDHRLTTCKLLSASRGVEVESVCVCVCVSEQNKTNVAKMVWHLSDPHWWRWSFSNGQLRVAPHGFIFLVFFLQFGLFSYPLWFYLFHNNSLVLPFFSVSHVVCVKAMVCESLSSPGVAARGQLA